MIQNGKKMWNLSFTGMIIPVTIIQLLHHVCFFEHILYDVHLRSKIFLIAIFPIIIYIPHVEINDLFTPRMGGAYIYVAVFFEYSRMRNFSVFSICSHCF